MKNGKTLLFAVVVTLLLLIATGIIFYQRKNLKDNEELSGYLKEELEDQYGYLSGRYEDYKLTIDNDSLFARLEIEQMRVQRLREELRTVKLTNTKRINELTKELKTLREILRHYVLQIDSLNRINIQLTDENRRVTEKYRDVTKRVTKLAGEKERLEETVEMASRLSTSNIMVKCLNNKNRTTNKIGRVERLEVSFTVNSNITASVGEKVIYVRIKNPLDELLTKSASHLFSYEGKDIGFSANRTIEFGGDEMNVVIYYEITETLVSGAYRVDIFADGNRIGVKEFVIGQ
ncbi:MAG: hypothetical protein LBF79_00915 [Dysgonamonadaceae bacterium]|jgi:hypothetical protein|nr:hypothetical protein [Dysgonamonadaceae bacterium]